MKFDEKDNFPAHNQGVPGSSPGGPTTSTSKNHKNARYQGIMGVLFLCISFILILRVSDLLYRIIYLKPGSIK